MTQSDSAETALEPEEVGPPRKYYINFDGYSAINRSRDIFLRDRMCAESKGTVSVAAFSARAQAEEGTGGRVRFNTRRGRASGGAAGDDPISTIQQCCSKKSEYRDPHLPAKEVLFRLLLAEGNHPMTTEELRAAVATWTGYEYGGGISAEGIAQLLEGDEYYGFAVSDPLA